MPPLAQLCGQRSHNRYSDRRAHKPAPEVDDVLRMLYPWRYLLIHRYTAASMQSLSDRDDDPFLLTSELEIRSILRSLQRHAALVRMYVRGNTEQSIMTTVLELDDNAQRFIVDCSSDTALNSRFAQADAIVFDTQLDQVNIHFSGGDLELIDYDGQPAFSVPYPPSLRRVQRREFYRVEIPLGEPVSCIIPIIELGKPPRRVEARLKDLSVGGLALLELDTEAKLPHQAGITFRDVRLVLPETGEVTVDLVVLRVHTQALPNKKELIELGCKFENISNADSNLIQSYIGRLERRLNAKRHGF